MSFLGYKFPTFMESDAMFSADKAPEWTDADVCTRCRVAFGMMQRKVFISFNIIIILFDNTINMVISIYAFIIHIDTVSLGHNLMLETISYACFYKCVCACVI